MKVAIIHDWLTGMRGGERVLEALSEIFPEAELWTLLHIRGRVSSIIERMPIHTSFVQHLPGVAKHYRSYLPLFPSAIRRFDLRGFDLILSVSHCVAKGVHRPLGSVHVAYLLTPMRYAWDLSEVYFGRLSLRPHRILIEAVLAHLRQWDRRSNVGVDHFVAISNHVAERVRRHYGREVSAVIYPPVDVGRFGIGTGAGGYYLVVSALAPYKRIDLAIAACSDLGRPLKIVGTGPEERRLRAMAGPAVEFLGWRTDHEVAGLYKDAAAVLFPGEEDFGIVPLEAQASGRPVIAFGQGGVRETVIPLNDWRECTFPARNGAVTGPTGVFFQEQETSALVGAIQTYERFRDAFDPAWLRQHASRFDRATFKARVASFIRERCAIRQLEV